MKNVLCVKSFVFLEGHKGIGLNGSLVSYSFDIDLPPNPQNIRMECIKFGEHVSSVLQEHFKVGFWEEK